MWNVNYKRLFTWFFALMWIGGLLAITGLDVIRFVVFYRDVALPSRVLLSLSTTNAWFHPDHYPGIFAEFEAFAGEAVRGDMSVYIVENHPPDLPRDVQLVSENLTRLGKSWLYPRLIAGVCETDTVQEITTGCALPDSDAIVLGWGFSSLPGFECEANLQGYVLCR